MIRQTALFALVGGTEEELRTTRTTFLARFWVHFCWAILTIKLGKFRHVWPKCRLQTGLIGKRKAKKPKTIWRDTSTFASQPSRGHVPFVLWKCPVCPTDILSSLWNYTEISSGRPGCPGGSPPNRPWDTSEAYRPPNSFMCSLFIGFFFSLAMAQVVSPPKARRLPLRL